MDHEKAVLATRLDWEAPRVTDLPPLTDLTLQTGPADQSLAGGFSYNPPGSGPNT